MITENDRRKRPRMNKGFIIREAADTVLALINDRELSGR
jgi:hypothetical protein